MLEPVIKQYNNTIHSSTNFKPVEAHKDINAPDVIANLTIKANYKRKYKNINVGDEVKIFDKGQGKYASRKETVSRWSDKTYKVIKIESNIALNNSYYLEGINKPFLRHELLLVG